jgi:hypothetical protein
MKNQLKTVALATVVLASAMVVGGQNAAPPARAAKPADGGGNRARFLERFARSYFPGRSGQIMVVPREGHIITVEGPDLSYMHGSPWPYDSAIPMLFVGKNVRPGIYSTPAVQQDVAVTVAAALKAVMPPTASGRVLPILRAGAAPPRAAVIIVLDGMRPDYFTRYAAQMPWLTALRKRSAWFTAASVNTMPTNTAVGHATIATGAAPGAHGITGNNMYESARKARHDMFAAWHPGDLAAQSLTDVWQLQTGGRAIVIAQGTSMPASVALAGHGGCQLNGTKVAHAGYDDRSGKWRTNTDCFVQPESLAQLDARTLWPADGLWMGQKVDTPSAIRRSALFPPFEATAFQQMLESLPVGQDSTTDLLLLNFKGADYAGHRYGPHSPQIAATLAEMDRQLARILETVEKQTGGDYLLAMTADHGMPGEPASPGGRHFAPHIVDTLHKQFDPEARTLITYYEPENAQIFVDRDRLAALKLTLADIARFVQQQPYIFAAYTEEEVQRAAR